MVYEQFAEVYADGEYTGHSKKMSEVMPNLLDYYGIEPDRILDLACGEGTFAREMGEKGYYVKGVDLSESLISIARERNEGDKVEFEVGNMTEFSEQGFDLVTCWYDSLNYIKEVSELKKVFRNVKNSLGGGGYFIFDVNTYRWLSEGWPSDPCYIAREDNEVFEVHKTSFDTDEEIFTLRITGFKKEKGVWKKFEEEHEEKAYRIDEVKKALIDTGFEVLDVFGDIEERENISKDDKRAWFVTKVSE